MRSSFPILALLLAGTLAAGAASAQTADLQRCRAISDPKARLACYDAVPIPQAVHPLRSPASRLGSSAAATPAAPATAPAPSLEARFGIERQAAVAELPSIQSHIPGVFEGWRPNSLIRLANGQVWQVADDSARMMDRRDPRVTVRRGALGSFFLDIEGDNRSPRVRRVQ